MLVKHQVPVTTFETREEDISVEVFNVDGEPVKVLPVQYRNYEKTIHIQGTTLKVNREYGFSLDIPGQATGKEENRTLLSKAGTGKKYWNGVLMVHPDNTLVLLAEDGEAYYSENTVNVNEPFLTIAELASK